MFQHFNPLVNNRALILSFACFSISFAAGCKADNPDSQPKNLALGKTYRIFPEPNYKLCTDPGDSIQLTDGVAAGCIWQRKSTVGWYNPEGVPTIIIDLGTSQRIGKIKIHTVGGGHAGVYFPAQALVLIGNNGHDYQLAETFEGLSLTRESKKTGRGVPHTFESKDLQMEGRFVCVAIQPDQSLVFVDEIEVLAPEVEEANARGDNRPWRSLSDLSRVFTESRECTVIQQEFDRFLDAQPSTRKSASDPVADAIFQRAHALKAELQDDAFAFPQKLEKLEQEFEVLRGRWLANRYKRDFVWHVVDPMQQPRRDDIYDQRHDQEAGSLALELWQGEYESGAVNLINCSDSPLKIVVSISPLQSKGGGTFSSADTVSLKHAVYVHAPGMGFIGDALPPIANDIIEISPGSVGQLWITVHNPELEPGRYDFSISLRKVLGNIISKDATYVHASVVVHPVRFPKQTTLKTHNWAYLSQFPFNTAELESTVADLTSHYTNVRILASSALPTGSVRPDGSVHVDFSKFDRAFDIAPDTEQFMFFWGMSDRNLKNTIRVRGAGEWMSSTWRTALKHYVNQWISHLKTRGIGYDRFLMYPFDESCGDQFYELLREIKSIDPRVRTFANTPGAKHPSEIKRLIPYVDQWCLPENVARSRKAREILRSSGVSNIWRYNVKGPARELSPYHYYRLQSWRAWADGDTGTGIWVYARYAPNDQCRGADYATCERLIHAVVYERGDLNLPRSSDRMITSRRWEAWRDGVEDYEYLVRTRDLADSMLNGPAHIKAKGRQLKKEIDKIVFNVSADSRNVYRARRQLTNAILESNINNLANLKTPEPD